MREPVRCRGARWILFILPLVAGCLAIGYALRVQVLQIGDCGPVFRVAEGETFSLRYTHSMYGVPVREEFRVEKNYLVLFHVASSDAALEYFAIEKREENNVRRALVEFSIPRASVGNHILLLRESEISLRDLAGQDEHVRIGIGQLPVITYVAKHVWG